MVVSRTPAEPDAMRRARFEALFRVAYEPLQRYVRRRAAPDVADDLVAEALTAVWRRLDDVPDDDRALAWCIGVARRCLANHRRSDGRRGRLVERLAAQPPSDVPAAVEDSIGGPVDDPQLMRALERLSADERELVQLWAWEGFEPREIAEVMGLSANAVSIRLHRLRRRLADDLNEGRKNEGSGGHMTGGRTEEAR